ncbi:hypothetical protein PC116_g32525 [Phytophthora cactorum]|nr:hypothetical protein PC116_g32525 [Phytophthora cactorum]
MKMTTMTMNLMKMKLVKKRNQLFPILKTGLFGLLESTERAAMQRSLRRHQVSS